MLVTPTIRSNILSFLQPSHIWPVNHQAGGFGRMIVLAIVQISLKKKKNLNRYQQFTACLSGTVIWSSPHASTCHLQLSNCQTQSGSNSMTTPSISTAHAKGTTGLLGNGASIPGTALAATSRTSAHQHPADFWLEQYKGNQASK